MNPSLQLAFDQKLIRLVDKIKGLVEDLVETMTAFIIIKADLDSYMTNNQETINSKLLMVSLSTGKQTLNSKNEPTIIDMN